MTEQNQHIKSMTQDWCSSCIHRWMYTDQEPCRACLSFTVNAEKPLHYESGGNTDV